MGLLLTSSSVHYPWGGVDISGLFAGNCNEACGKRSSEFSGRFKIVAWNCSNLDNDRSRRGIVCCSQQLAASTLEFTNKPTSNVPNSSLKSAASNVIPSTQIAPSKSSAAPHNRISIADLMAPVAEDLLILNENLNRVVGADNPLLMTAAEQIFKAGGKRMRPALVLLVSRATAEIAGLENLMPEHRKLAEIIEMMHTASLIHDDVLDESVVRRGKETIHQQYGTRIAVLAGDYLFAQTSWFLANLENIEVIKLISQVIKDFAIGEIKQATSLFDCDFSLDDYLDKCYCKTASLVAASTCSAAIFSGVSADIQNQMLNYGKNLGLAFQVVDDILDFTQSTERLGKPAGSDLVKGNLTAPVLFALEQIPKLRELIESEFTGEGSLAIAVELVHKSGGIDKAHSLAKQNGDAARKCLDCLPQGSVRSSLEGMVDYVLERLN
eukprot:c25181_g1_i2 orf=712-2028(+)